MKPVCFMEFKSLKEDQNNVSEESQNKTKNTKAVTDANGTKRTESLSFKKWKTLKGGQNNATEETQNKEKNTKAISNGNIGKEMGSLCFKEWKALKDRQNNDTKKSQFIQKNTKPNRYNYKNFPSRENTYFNNGNRCNVHWVPHLQESPKFFPGKINVPSSSNLSRMNNYKNFCIQFNGCGCIHNSFNYTGSSNLYNTPSNCGNHFFNEFNSIKFKHFPNCLGLINPFGKDGYILNEPNIISNCDQHDNFFSSDSIYYQRDMMQKPLLQSNTFRYKQLLQNFNDKSCLNKEQNQKKGNKNRTELKSSTCQQAEWGESQKLYRESKVFVPNPKAKIDGKPYIPKPKIPIENFDITKEEKKKQWKDYREAMKPFKNRDFYNAKRVVQRFGKKSLSELNEKEIIRLAKAREVMTAHKARLSAKYPNYIKADDSTKLGELYVLKKKPINGSQCTNPASNQLQNRSYICEDFEAHGKI